ncbi:hypothetical protein LOTGIDRAFT_173486 [Lottia gigantea]|uniref:EGF-like domain-containing protein n=1 Tax=Lottia gigantea TaxID=225164 RepID=V4A7C7_LOTGI|nr:hypothetical protein LOTGIDRAFT_173486 [Lottia gigantea]ESO99828.1 hypothetical protein LOTGIDRAFT_173486 [Lottia gigantea]
MTTVLSPFVSFLELIPDCQNGGQFVAEDGKLKCSCPSKTFGDDCSLGVCDVESENPCASGSTCIPGENIADVPNCVCTPGTTGKYCNELIPDCQNGGQFVAEDGKLKCSCPSKTFGDDCSLGVCDVESENPCASGSTCIPGENIADVPNCVCTPGTTGKYCNDTIKDCKNGAEQKEVNGEFICDCVAGTFGDDCSLGVCDVESENPCASGSTCIPGENIADDPNCVCFPGTTGKYCDDTIKDCKNGAEQKEVNGEFICDCVAGTFGDDCMLYLKPSLIFTPQPSDYLYTYLMVSNNIAFDDVKGILKKMLKWNHLQGLGVCDLESENPCASGSTCIPGENIADDPNCVCSPGTTGKYCDDTIKDCKNGAEQKEVNGEFICDCVAGTFGDDCSLGVCDVESENPCANGSTCIPGENIADAPRCVCSPGTTGKYCDDTIKDCKNGAEQKEVNGEFICDCVAGTFGDDCSLGVCDVENPCANGSTCIPGENITDVPNCVCLPGTTGKYCDDTIKDCKNGAEQKEVNGEFICDCVAGTFGDDCNTIKDCKNGAEQKEVNGEFICDCVAGTFGDDCSLGVCDVENPCANGSTCIPGENITDVPNCVCLPGTTGKYCDGLGVCDVENPCANGSTCIPGKNITDVPNCVCSPGTTGKYCDDTIKDCKNGAEQKEVNGEFICDCVAGTFGDDCSLGVCDVESENPCANGSTCIPGENITDVPNCVCLPGATGKYCDECGYNYSNETDLFPIPYMTETLCDKAKCDANCAIDTKCSCATVSGDGVCQLYETPVIFVSYDANEDACFERCNATSECKTIGLTKKEKIGYCFLFNVTLDQIPVGIKMSKTDESIAAEKRIRTHGT